MVWAISLPQEWPRNVDHLGLFQCPFQVTWAKTKQPWGLLLGQLLCAMLLEVPFQRCLALVFFFPRKKTLAGQTRMAGNWRVVWRVKLGNLPFSLCWSGDVDITRWSQKICSLDLGFLAIFGGKSLIYNYCVRFFWMLKRRWFIYIDLFIHPKMVERISTLELWKSECSSQIFSMLSRTIEFVIW